jgi:PAS domain S-box-containing protein
MGEKQQEVPGCVTRPHKTFTMNMDRQPVQEKPGAEMATHSREVEQLRQELEQTRAEKKALENQLAMRSGQTNNTAEPLVPSDEQKFQAVIETLPVPVVISRLSDGTIIYVNQAIETLLGLPLSAILGQTIADFYENRDERRRIYTTIRRRGSLKNHELQANRADGTPFWVELSAQTLTFNNEPCLLNVLYIIEERKQAETEHSCLTQNLEESLKQHVALTTAYSRFVPSEILKFLGKETVIDLKLGEHIQQQMTVLFSDIRDFTSLSEQMTPQENFNFINSYLGRVSPIIRKNKGYIDKYIGDAIMALFPGEAFPGQADDAIEAAIEMHKEVFNYNKHRAKLGYSPISIGVGLHTGSVMLGTVGEEKRMEGTVISDVVNLASRMEGLTKTYGAAIVVSDRTLFSLERVMKYSFRFLDKVRVKGRNAPVSVFEIFADITPGSVELKLKTQTDFEKGLLHYHSEEFHEAREYFKQVLTVDQSDRAAQLYLQRATSFLEYGVPLDWEGIAPQSDK